jgi:glutathione peroxidase
MGATLYEHNVRTPDGTETTLESFRGKVLLIVNTASECVFTRQFEGLQKLYAQYRDRGFVVLAFPCNQFGDQEPLSGPGLVQFCGGFGVTFPVFERVDVKGDTAHPLFRELTSRAPGILGTTAIKWNFTKFLIDRRASSVMRFAPVTTPAELRDEIEIFL